MGLARSAMQVAPDRVVVELILGGQASALAGEQGADHQQRQHQEDQAEDPVQDVVRIAVVDDPFEYRLEHQAGLRVRLAM